MGLVTVKAAEHYFSHSKHNPAVFLHWLVFKKATMNKATKYFEVNAAIVWLKIANYCAYVMPNDPQYYDSKRRYALGNYNNIVNQRAKQ